MDDQKKRIAHEINEGAATGSLDFGQIVGTLLQSGFDGYLVDFRAATQTFYLPDGGAYTVPVHATHHPVAASFDPETVRAAIREAQTKAPGYTYPGFCETVVRAGCAGYLVTFPGRCVLYFGRDGRTHTELFPDRAPALHP